MSKGGIIAIVGVAAATGGIIWWLRSRDKAAANQQALVTATKSAIMSAVPPSKYSTIPGLTAAQVNEMLAHPEARRGAAHFGTVQATEAQANTGAGHF